MGSSGKKKTTFAKLARESKLRERRLEKQAKKDARKRGVGVDPAQVGVDPAQVGVDPAGVGIDPAQVGVEPAPVSDAPAGEDR